MFEFIATDFNGLNSDSIRYDFSNELSFLRRLSSSRNENFKIFFSRNDTSRNSFPQGINFEELNSLRKENFRFLLLEERHFEEFDSSRNRFRVVIFLEEFLPRWTYSFLKERNPRGLLFNFDKLDSRNFHRGLRPNSSILISIIN